MTDMWLDTLDQPSRDDDGKTVEVRREDGGATAGTIRCESDEASVEFLDGSRQPLAVFDAYRFI